MKKVALVLALAATAFAGNTVIAAETTKVASSVATWEVTATKDTKSMLVVTPLKSLNFQYAEDAQRFNQLTGNYSIAIEGQAGATDFKLEGKLITDTLYRASDDSELTVGVSVQGTKLEKATATTLVDVKTGKTALLPSIAAGYNKAERTTGRGGFNFTIDSASVATVDTKFSELTDGAWDGEVSIEFTATWTGEFI